MENEFIPYEQALALKELGFNEPCFRFQNNISNIIEEKSWLNWNEVEQFVSFPLYQQAFRWFREKYDMFVEITYENNLYDYFIVSDVFTEDVDFGDGPFKTYEKMELACLIKLIELAKPNCTELRKL
jgi:hypothetical protein